MNNLDIASYIDAVNKSIKEPTKERIIFVNKYMPIFLHQMLILFDTNDKRFKEIYYEIVRTGHKELLQKLNNITSIPVEYDGGKRLKSKRRIKKYRKISRKNKK